MSELKAKRAYFSEDEYERGAHKICAKVSDCGYDRKNDWWSYAFEDEVYLKSEADKVIAKKDAEISRLKAIRKVHVEAIESMGAGLQQDEEKILHHKYRRCLAMSSYWGLISALVHGETQLKCMRREMKWRKLAEKFKPNKEAML